MKKKFKISIEISADYPGVDLSDVTDKEFAERALDKFDLESYLPTLHIVRKNETLEFQGSGVINIWVDVDGKNICNKRFDELSDDF